MNYCSVDRCFCYKCVKIAKDCLRESIAADEAKERREKGTSSLIDTEGITGSGMSSMATTKKTMKSTKNIGPGPRRLLKEEDLDLIRDDLCKKCRVHVKSYIHLTCGREGQHILSDIEINELVREINRTDVYELLKIEKGSTAKVMIDTLNLKELEQIMYTESDIMNLFVDLDTDYYERYSFDEMQKVILQDRKIRINYFTTKCIAPTTLPPKRVKGQNDVEVDYNTLHFNHTAKLLQNEQDLIMERTIAKEFHRISGLESTNSKDVAVNAVLLRNYNDGRHGKWNNYCTFVKSKNSKKKDIIE